MAIFMLQTRVRTTTSTETNLPGISQLPLSIRSSFFNNYYVGRWLLVAIVFLGLGACSNKNAPAAEPPLGPIVVVVDPQQVTRPIERYLVGRDAVMGVAQWTADHINDCLTAAGQAATYKLPEGLPTFVERGRDNFRKRSPLWGLFDPSTSARFGYRLPPDSGLLTEQGPAGADAAAFDSCRSDAQKATIGGQGWFALTITESLPNRGPQTPSNDTRWLAAERAWSKCMSGRGFRYRSPVDLMYYWYDRGDAPLGAAELSSAKADLDCKRQTNLVGIGSAVQAAYDQLYIEKNQAALTDFRAAVDTFMREEVGR